MASYEVFLSFDGTQFVEVVENDGPRYVRRGPERKENPLSLNQAIKEYGEKDLCFAVRDYLLSKTGIDFEIKIKDSNLL